MPFLPFHYALLTGRPGRGTEAKSNIAIGARLQQVRELLVGEGHTVMLHMESKGWSAIFLLEQSITWVAGAALGGCQRSSEGSWQPLQPVTEGTCCKMSSLTTTQDTKEASSHVRCRY